MHAKLFGSNWSVAFLPCNIAESVTQREKYSFDMSEENSWLRGKSLIHSPHFKLL